MHLDGKKYTKNFLDTMLFVIMTMIMKMEPRVAAMITALRPAVGSLVIRCAAQPGCRTEVLRG